MAMKLPPENIEILKAIAAEIEHPERLTKNKLIFVAGLMKNMLAIILEKVEEKDEDDHSNAECSG